MGIIGNACDAETIRDYAVAMKSHHDFWTERPTMPEGWRELGDGCFRRAFLSPDGVVYKVQKDYANRYGQTNEGEYKNLLHGLACEAPEHTRMPRFTYYELDGRGVMAMERIHGETLEGLTETGDEPEDGFHRLCELEDAYGIMDGHCGNVVVEEKTGDLVLIDWGH